MTLMIKTTALVAMLSLSACGAGGYFGDTRIEPGAGAAAGSAADPNSVAYFTQTVGDRVLFPVDESSLTVQARATLDDQADWLLRNMEYTALIEGHADEQGTREYNLALGARRAAAVQAYLVDRGIAASRLRTVSYGKERPIEICSEEACYSQNRRSVTVVSAGIGS